MGNSKKRKKKKKVGYNSLGMIAIAFISPIKIRKPDMKMMKIMVAVGIGAVVFIIKTIMRQKGI